VARDRRQQLLDVAAELFAERGFHRVTVDDLGAAVGVSGPALYHHFDGKEELLGEILVAISEQLLEGGKARVAQAADPADALDRLLQFHIAFSLSRPALITVHFRELVHAPEADRRRVRQLQGEYVEQWVDVLTDLDASLDRTTARAATHAALGLMNSTPHSARLGRGPMRQLLLRMARAAIGSAGDGMDGRQVG
jgi:AcrR family transcriptional regulator